MRSSATIDRNYGMLLTFSDFLSIRYNQFPREWAILESICPQTSPRPDPITPHYYIFCLESFWTTNG